MSATVQAKSPSGAAKGADASQVIIDCKINNLYYGKFRAIRDSRIPIEKGKITAFIGPSGCGKSTALRCLNRMNDLVRGFRLEGHVHFRGQDIYATKIDPVVVRRYIGMVFQQPNPFAMSIFDNVAFGLRLNRYKGDIHERVEKALQGAAIWDEAKDKLKQSGLSLSGGQQQRLCIARAIATEPEVLLMDEPCSALDPIATRRIEELMAELKKRYTIAIVTHNLQQAMRVADKTAFMYVDTSGQQQRLCIARAIATEPEVLLMDEPCSALDPIATRRIEELMAELKKRYTIAIVTHNLQQAMRVADKTAFMYVDTSGGGRTGYLVEYGDTKEMFDNPKEEYTRQYIRGEFS